MLTQQEMQLVLRFPVLDARALPIFITEVSFFTTFLEARLLSLSGDIHREMRRNKRRRLRQGPVLISCNEVLEYASLSQESGS